MFRFFERLVAPFDGMPETAPPATFWAYLADHLRPFRRVLGFITLTGLATALVETGLIYYAGHVVDLLAEGEDGFWSRNGLELVLISAFVLLLRPVAITLNHLLLNQALSTNLLERVRWRAHRHLLGQSIGFHQNDFAGRLANRVMQTGPAVEDSAFMSFEALWYAAAYFIGALLVLSEIDWRLSIPLLLWLLIYLALLRALIPAIGRASQKYSAARSTLTGRIVDSYSNIATVKLFAHGRREEAFALSAMKSSRLRFARMLRLMTLMMAGIAAVNGLVIVAVVGAAIWLWSLGDASIGAVSAAAALTLRLNGMTGWIMWVTSQLFQHAGVIREGMESISQPHDVTDAPGASDLKVTGGEIAFRGLRHHYGKQGGGLEGIDLVIRPGERVGLVGRSGAGKSTLVNLLLRFQDPEAGRIEIDGQDVRSVTQDSLRRRIGMVTQDTALLHRSVRDNILYGRPEAGEAAMVAAARRVSAHDFILGLRDFNGRSGYEAHVGERGVKLSGGQRQRIALARVVLKDAPILVLDEATSALDSEVEAEIQAALTGLMAGKTVIAIAHRLSTIAQMDRIVVLDGGRVAEQGPHAELLAARGLYAGFWARQSGGFIGLEDAGPAAAE
ncbi:ABC transporter ATP-binding protein [Rubrimonas cliftonensis]|uniref:ATP-binding cassette, subfamily B, multidrug efflux pump n=1 Tax=Rubrimonas cliftonensis TaxID=89524 RepID=A0A1H3YT70_9RHOB|nr:ABC transporter ATP-binding protein [Rubrimonas cliftonensis]SEA14765.1 ATP-binding cassette, subfamily B, multidrug efflux pump [Rubrimonas cliftonensis]